MSDPIDLLFEESVNVLRQMDGDPLENALRERAIEESEESTDDEDVVAEDFDAALDAATSFLNEEDEEEDDDDEDEDEGEDDEEEVEEDEGFDFDGASALEEGPRGRHRQTRGKKPGKAGGGFKKKAFKRVSMTKHLKKKRYDRKYKKGAGGIRAGQKEKRRSKKSTVQTYRRRQAATAIKRGTRRSMADAEMEMESMDILNQIEAELSESAPRVDTPSARMVPHFGSVTHLDDPGTFGIPQDASTAPRQTVTFGAPVMPYLDNLQNNADVAMKLGEMCENPELATKLIAFAEFCNQRAQEVHESGFTDDEFGELRRTAMEATQIVRDALADFQEQGYFEENSDWGRIPQSVQPLLKKAESLGADRIAKGGNDVSVAFSDRSKGKKFLKMAEKALKGQGMSVSEVHVGDLRGASIRWNWGQR